MLFSLQQSLGAAISFRYDMLVAFRAVQGIGAALMMPSALSIITKYFRQWNRTGEGDRNFRSIRGDRFG